MRTFARARSRWLRAPHDRSLPEHPPVPEGAEGAVDEIAIELACSGERMRLTPLERREAVSRLVAVKLNDHAIAERLHVTAKTVLRIRQELGLAAAVGADRQVVA